MCRVVSCRIVLRYAVLFSVMPCSDVCAVSCHSMSCRVVLYFTLLRFALLYSILPRSALGFVHSILLSLLYCIVLCFVLLCFALLCFALLLLLLHFTLPYVTLPYLTLPYPSLLYFTLLYLFYSQTQRNQKRFVTPYYLNLLLLFENSCDVPNCFIHDINHTSVDPPSFVLNKAVLVNIGLGSLYW